MILKVHHNKDEVTLNSFPILAYVSSNLHLKSFVWKQDYTISLKLEMLRSLSKHSRIRYMSQLFFKLRAVELAILLH